MGSGGGAAGLRRSAAAASGGSSPCGGEPGTSRLLRFECHAPASMYSRCTALTMSGASSLASAPAWDRSQEGSGRQSGGGRAARGGGGGARAGQALGRALDTIQSCKPCRAPPRTRKSWSTLRPGAWASTPRSLRRWPVPPSSSSAWLVILSVSMGWRCRGLVWAPPRAGPPRCARCPPPTDAQAAAGARTPTLVPHAPDSPGSDAHSLWSTASHPRRAAQQGSAVAGARQAASCHRRLLAAPAGNRPTGIPRPVQGPPGALALHRSPPAARCRRRCPPLSHNRRAQPKQAPWRERTSRACGSGLCRTS